MGQPNARFRFRLRTLFLFVLLIAVPFGVWRTCFAPYRAQWEAMVALSRAGGFYTDSRVRGPAWLRSVFGDSWSTEFVAISVPTGDDSEVVESIFRLPALSKLSVSGHAFTDEHLARLSRLQDLREVVLTGTSVSRTSVDALGRARPDVALLIGLSFEELAQKGPAADPNMESVRQLGVPTSVSQWVGKRVQLVGCFWFPNESVGSVRGCEMGPRFRRVRPGKGVAVAFRSEVNREEFWKWAETLSYSGAEGILEVSPDLSDSAQSVYQLSDARIRYVYE